MNPCRMPSRETIKTRIELWIAATTRRLLAPLFALEGLQEGPEIVRDLAQELVRSFGVLEREPIKAKIRALSQDDRAELRKQGVRFGAYYLFLPMLLKPAARTLALQLWGLQASGDATELLRTLGPVASSGRTSLASDKGIWERRVSRRRLSDVRRTGCARGRRRAPGRNDPSGDRWRSARRRRWPSKPADFERIRRQRSDDIVDRVLRRAIRFDFALHGIPVGRNETIGILWLPIGQ